MEVVVIPACIRRGSKKMSRIYYIYILASKKNGALYVGITNDLIKRVWIHKEKIIDGFTRKYKINRLVYYEASNNSLSAIEREKRIKKWNRKWKIRLIEKQNPLWKDLYETIAS